MANLIAWKWPAARQGDSVMQCLVDYGFGITTESGMALRIECAFTYRKSDSVPVLYDPNGDPPLLGPVLSVVRSAVVNGFADEAGALHIEFSDGSTIDVLPDERYEAWTLAGPDGLLLVSLPGDGLAIWSADATPAAQDGDQPSSAPV